MRVSSALVPLGLLCVVGVLIADSQTQVSTQAPPVFRAGVDLVQLDVSVLDKDRQPIRGLTADDFSVRQDGVPQKIAAFAAVDLPDVVTSKTEWVKKVSSDVTTNQIDNRRLFCIVIDDAAIQSDLIAMKNMKAVAHRVIDKLGPSDLATVMFTRDNRNTRDFTSDHARLHAAADAFTVGFRDMGTGGDLKDADWQSFRYSVNAIEEIAHYLIAAPDKRKALVYIGQGVPADFGKLTPVQPIAGFNPAIMSQGLMAALLNQMKEIFLQAERANVNIYAFDVCGLRPDGGRKRGTMPASCVPGLEIDYLLTIAENTGGRAVVNTDEFEPGIQQMFVENGSFYLLGYQPDRPQAAGSFSRVEVTVNRPDAHVRSRRINYREPTDDERAARAHHAPPTPVVKAMTGILPNPETPMRVVLAPFAAPRTGGATVAIVLGVSEPAPVKSSDAGLDDHVVETVELLTRAFTPEGAARGSQTQTARLTLRHGDPNAEVRYEVLARIDIAKPGRYTLRVAAHNNERNKNGSVFADVEIPDFAHAPLSLSGVIIDSATAPVSAPEKALASLTPFVPTTDREFMTTSQVRAFLRVYTGGKAPLAPVQMKATILDQNDAAVFTMSTTIAATRFNADHSAEFKFDLPLTTLGLGQHLLTIEATMGKATARRDVAFVMSSAVRPR